MVEDATGYALRACPRRMGNFQGSLVVDHVDRLRKIRNHGPMDNGGEVFILDHVP